MANEAADELVFPSNEAGAAEVLNTMKNKRGFLTARVINREAAFRHRSIAGQESISPGGHAPPILSLTAPFLLTGLPSRQRKSLATIRSEASKDRTASYFFNTSSIQVRALIMLGKPSVVVASKATWRISAAEHPASTARRV